MTSLSFNQKLVAPIELEKSIPRSRNPVVESEKVLPLKYSWCLWEQLQQNQPVGQPAEGAVPSAPTTTSTTYGDLTRKVATLSDVQTFWKYFLHLPQPSAILGESMKVIRQDSEDGPAHTLAALMLFKDNIRPEWEDEANRKGGHFQFTLQFERSRSVKDGTTTGKDHSTSNWLAQTDEYWNNIVLALIGGTLDANDFVTGVRLVDKVKLPVKAGARPVGHIRVEIWFRDATDKVQIAELEKTIEAHLKCRIDGSMASEVFPGYRLDMRTHEESAGGAHGEGDKAAGSKGPRKTTMDKPGGVGLRGKFGVRKGSTDVSHTGEGASHQADSTADSVAH